MELVVISTDEEREVEETLVSVPRLLPLPPPLLLLLLLMPPLE